MSLLPLKDLSFAEQMCIHSVFLGAFKNMLTIITCDKKGVCKGLAFNVHTTYV